MQKQIVRLLSIELYQRENANSINYNPILTGLIKKCWLEIHKLK